MGWRVVPRGACDPQGSRFRPRVWTLDLALRLERRDTSSKFKEYSLRTLRALVQLDARSARGTIVQGAFLPQESMERLRWRMVQSSQVAHRLRHHYRVSSSRIPLSAPDPGLTSNSRDQAPVTDHSTHDQQLSAVLKAHTTTWQHATFEANVLLS